jgi:hypothetical protein
VSEPNAYERGFQLGSDLGGIAELLDDQEMQVVLDDARDVEILVPRKDDHRWQPFPTICAWADLRS